MAPSLFQSADDPTPGTNAIPCHTLGLFRRRADHAPVAVRGGPRPRHILVVSGSLGGRFVLNAVRTLVAAPSLDVRVIAVCGRDAAGLEALRALQAWVGPERLECLGYVDDLARRMREADVLLARPSANVFLEAVLAGLPMVVPSRTTLNDMGAVALVRRWGIGETYARHRDMVATLRGLLENLDAYRARVLDARSRRAASPEQAAARIRDVVWRRGAALKSP
jgi:UDP-N-acetylglucosamine:LPS N-acetylglucosamine transferase